LQLESRVLDKELKETKEIKVRMEISICPINKSLFCCSNEPRLGYLYSTFYARHELFLIFAFSFSSIPRQNPSASSA
jgi:hypothetical protein